LRLAGLGYQAHGVIARHRAHRLTADDAGRHDLALGVHDLEAGPHRLKHGSAQAGGTLQLLLEVRFGMMAAIVAGFGRVIAEVGVAMMLGGNIRGTTRTMTTAIALETSKGEFAFGLALGIVLMSVALIVNLFLNLLQQR
jgi:tungstate transport system permease protein